MEKSLKAWLATRRLPVPLIHDLDRLLNLLEADGEEVAAFRPLFALTAFGVEWRYSAFPEYEALDRDQVLAACRALLLHVQNLAR